MNNLIYMDNAATTMVLPEVLDAMMPFYKDFYGNPSGSYSFAEISKNAINDSRKIIADTLNTMPHNIYFTNGGTESDNWALKSIADSYGKNYGHIITSKIEHHAILNTCNYLKKKNYDITYIDVDEFGIINLKQLENSIRNDTILISVMFANNETGVIQPIKEIGEIAKKHNIIFHTDAVAAYGHININVDEYNIDLLSVSGHKFHAPKGVGFLYVRDGIDITSFIHGGDQENKLRAGTENVAGIVGMGTACKIAYTDSDSKRNKELILREKLITRILKELPFSRLNGSLTNRLSSNVNFSFQFIESPSLMELLNEQGICASGGSACTSAITEPSHVLSAMGLPDDIASGALRLTFNSYTTEAEIDYICEMIIKDVNKLREMSSLYTFFIS
ncbi:MAG: cysteine desulfurase [Lachnospiraceae bacterium]|nr:cysteine desulfurase [Lachnospiraceae bacterium]